jgi:hypothetical protein
MITSECDLAQNLTDLKAPMIPMFFKKLRLLFGLLKTCK